MARRGIPKSIYSDNATNFRGADLKNALTQVDQEKLCQEFSSAEIKWNFIPPTAAHMGGSCERLIRSVKRSVCFPDKH